jgi:AraC-like DNA-binding protein
MLRFERVQVAPCWHPEAIDTTTPNLRPTVLATCSRVLHPQPSHMDPVSDALRAVRLTGAYFYLVEAAGPWAVASVPARELVPRILPEVEHLIAYHILVAGESWGAIEGEPQVRMRVGDVMLFPHGDAHVMSSGGEIGPGSARTTMASARYPETLGLGPVAERGTRLVCGFLGCDARPYNPVLSSLPRQLHLSGVASGWLSQFPQQVVAESRAGRVGSETMLPRMAELMFAEVVRRHVEAMTPEQTGWLAGLRDAVVGPALAQLHARPAHAWTLDELARTVASSRSVLAERFSRLVGMAPMQYLTRWRLQLAAERLARGSAKVSAIGAQVGYDSEAAFSRAFKRETGQSPAAWRRSRRAAS